MIQAGTSVTASGELMKKLPVDYLINSIKSPRQEVATKIRQIRAVRQLDYNQYSILKKQLPYFVCGIFNPAVRKTENFLYIEYFVLDIDKLSDKGFTVQEIRRRVEQDSRVRLSFISPGEDGLKIMFKLSERCYDARIYSLFYKSFVTHFSSAYNLEQVIDARTSDVSRACFISIDPDAYYNGNSESVNLSAFINVDDSNELFRMHKQDKKEQLQTKVEKVAGVSDPDSDSLAKIKQILNPKLKVIDATRQAVYVPEQLDEIMSSLRVYVTDNGVELIDVVNIQYGKKLRFKLGLRLAEINLFYGKRGFSVVVSPKSGTNQELNDTMADLLKCFLFEIQNMN